jgi:hypothetical protein
MSVVASQSSTRILSIVVDGNRALPQGKRVLVAASNSNSLLQSVIRLELLGQSAYTSTIRVLVGLVLLIINPDKVGKYQDGASRLAALVTARLCAR